MPIRNRDEKLFRMMKLFIHSFLYPSIHSSEEKAAAAEVLALSKCCNLTPFSILARELVHRRNYWVPYK